MLAKGLWRPRAAGPQDTQPRALPARGVVTTNTAGCARGHTYHLSRSASSITCFGHRSPSNWAMAPRHVSRPTPGCRGRAICNFTPNLFRAIGSRRRSRSVRDALANRQWARGVTGAPTVAVLVEYVQLWDRVDHVQLQPHTPDKFIWKWTANGEYSSPPPTVPSSLVQPRYSAPRRSREHRPHQK